MTREEVTEPGLAALAARQHGVVSRAQLLDLGLSSSAIGRRVAVGRLHPVSRGVYAVGHPVLTPHARWMAAVLACGPGAVLGYRPAAALWSLGARGRQGPMSSCPATAGAGAPACGSTTTRASPPGSARRTAPVTTPARTLLDLAAAASDRGLKYALDQPELRELTDYPALDALARAHPGHRGSARLRATLASYEAGTARTGSGLEIAFLALCERHGLPRPLVNHELLPAHTVDFVFAAQRVAVETDSRRRHRGRAAFEDDRERDAVLAATGYRTLRFTDRRIEHRPATVARAIAGALDASAAEPDDRPWPEPESAA